MSVWVSITGLRLRSLRHLPAFWWHALRTTAQVKRAPGLISMDLRSIAGVQHTLTVWEDKASMQDFMRSGAHARAMVAFPRIASGRITGYEADKAPDWDQALVRWSEGGRDYD